MGVTEIEKSTIEQPSPRPQTAEDRCTLDRRDATEGSTDNENKKRHPRLVARRRLITSDMIIDAAPQSSTDEAPRASPPQQSSTTFAQARDTGIDEIPLRDTKTVSRTILAKTNKSTAGLEVIRGNREHTTIRKSRAQSTKRRQVVADPSVHHSSSRRN